MDLNTMAELISWAMSIAGIFLGSCGLLVAFTAAVCGRPAIGGVVMTFGGFASLYVGSRVRAALVEDESAGDASTKPAPEPSLPEIDWSLIGWIAAGVGGSVATIFIVSYLYRKAQLARGRDAIEKKRLDRIWDESVQRHDELREQWLSFQQDIDKVLSFPLLSDVAEPKTAAFIEALGVAGDLSSDRRPRSAEEVERYAKATRAAETRWQAALLHAQRTRLARFAPGERDRIKKVQRLLQQAMNGGASPEERRTYFQRARELLGDLIPLPEPARLALEQSVRGELAAPVLGKHRRGAAQARH